MGGKRNTVLVEKHRGKRPLGRYMRRWENNIKFFSPRTGSRDRFLWPQYRTFGLQKKGEEFLEWLINY
jgi:hypothetical protein